MKQRRLLCMLLVAVMFISNITGIIYTWSDGTQDYRETIFKNDDDITISKPTAQFSLAYNGTMYNSPSGKELNSTAITIFATVGDTVSLKDLSHSNRGKALKAWDFQYTRPDSNNEFIKTKAFEKSYTLDISGTYTFSLCVRDNVEDEAWTNYWGNWSDNGNHRVIGNNPGKNLHDPSDDFDGYWYFTRIVVIAREKSYTLEEKHIDTNSGRVLREELHEGTTENTYTTTKKNFDEYSFIGSRAGYTWSEIANGTTENIPTRTANFDSSHTNAFHYYYYQKAAPPEPPAPGKADIVVYYKDKISGAAVYPADETTYKGVSYGTYSIPALPDKDGYTFDPSLTPSPQSVTVDAGNNSETVTFYYIPTELPPANEPPVAKVTGPLKKLAGENVVYNGSKSYDPDGEITNYHWDYPDANFLQKSAKGDRLTVWYPYTGNYTREEEATLTVTDDTGNTDSDSHYVEILPPVPQTSLTVSGIFKENRKVTLDASESYSPSRYPINNYLWTVSNSANMKSVAALNGNAKNDVIFKTANTYSIKVETPNTVGLSDDETKSITIVPDQNPIANFAATTKLLREPNNSNIATITISNLTKSPDSDTIKKTVMFYCYDSDNDGNFDEEVWKYSTNGTTWNNVGLAYSQIKTNFDIYNIAGGNPLNFTIKTNQVGKYKFEAMAIEDIPATTTIPELLTPADYKRGSTFTSKPDSEKIVDVINTAPVVSFEVKKKKEVDILIATDYTGQKLANLQAALNIQKATLLAKNIDVKYTIINATTSVAHINDAMYWYRRYARYSFKADKETWNSSGDGNDYYNKWFENNILWEEKQCLESEAAYLPIRNPIIVNWYKSSEIYEEEPDDDTPDWERRYYNIYINTSNDGYKNSGSFDFTRYRRSGLNSSTGGTYGYEYRNIHKESTSVDKNWNKDEKISDVFTDIKSLDFDSLNSIPLRENSDRYIMFISDSSTKKFSLGWGNYFPFGGLTEEAKNYIKNNNIKPYIVTPQNIIDTTLGADKVIKVFAGCENLSLYNGDVTYVKTLDGSWKIIIANDYPIDINLGGEIQEVYGEYVLLTNGILKYRMTGANFITMATSVTKVIEEKMTYYDTAGKVLWAVTSDGKLRQFKGDSAGLVLDYPNAIDIYNNNGVPCCDGTYTISCTDGTYFIYTNGTSIRVGTTSLAYTNYTRVEDNYLDDRQWHGILFVFSNGVLNVGLIWEKSYWDSERKAYVYYIDKLQVRSLYKGYYDAEEDIYKANRSVAFPTVNPLENEYCMYNGHVIGYNYFSIFEDYSGTYPRYGILYNSDYDTPGKVSSYIKGIYKYKDGTLGIPCTYQYRYIRKEDWYYNWHTVYIDAPELRNKTFKQVIAVNGITTILTTDGQVYRWYSPGAYNGIQNPTALPPFELIKNNIDDIYKNIYNESSSYRQVPHIYYWNKKTLALKELYTDEVVYNDVVSVVVNPKNTNIYVINKHGKLYGQGYFGAKNYYGYMGTPFFEIIKSRPIINDITKNYIDFRKIMNSIPITKYFTTGKYATAIQDITNIYLNDTSYTTNYILVGDEVKYKTVYNDYESDPKHEEIWRYFHDAYYFDNSMGLADFHGKELTLPVTRYNRKGCYTINAKVRDNPKNDVRFKNDTNEAYNYYKWSTGNQNVILYVHRKPIALARVTITNNGNSTYTVKALDAGSYDLDHSISRADKGIAAREWRWKESTETNWHYGQMNKSDCTADKSYIIQLRVQDIEGAWSDYNTIEIDKDNPPVALFNIEKPIIATTEYLKVKDQSYPQSFSTITNWHWIVNKVNADGTETKIYTKNAAESNTGTGSLVGYDRHVKYSYGSVGKYRVYLRVKNSNGLWSDGGTDSSYSLNSFYSQDFEVDCLPTANFVIEKSPIYVEETLKLKDQSTATGTSPLARWHWIVKKLNADGSVPGTNIQDAKFTDSNNGTGSMEGFDVNVKTLYADKGPGTYRIYLRVMNGNDMWSDEGTESSYNLNRFFYIDLKVQESFKMSNFRVARIRDLHLEPYYNVNGKYPDRPFYVNSMAIDPGNFEAGGIGIVPGFCSLTKGYRFEFEIDTVNFNEAKDTIVITPIFHTYTPGVPGTRGSEADLYWEDSDKNIHKAGEGGHSRWAEIVLDSSNRTITGENEATWRGEYFIPATSWPVPLGTAADNAKVSKINADIIVNFTIRGHKAGVMKYDYNTQQWPVERTSEKHPYEIGDVIRYDHTKSCLDDQNIIINRP